MLFSCGGSSWRTRGAQLLYFPPASLAGDSTSSPPPSMILGVRDSSVKVFQLLRAELSDIVQAEVPCLSISISPDPTTFNFDTRELDLQPTRPPARRSSELASIPPAPARAPASIIEF